VITSVQRRRRWAISEKERIVAAALEPGAVALEVAQAAQALLESKHRTLQ
jgi:transposase